MLKQTIRLEFIFPLLLAACGSSVVGSSSNSNSSTHDTGTGSKGTGGQDAGNGLGDIGISGEVNLNIDAGAGSTQSNSETATTNPIATDATVTVAFDGVVNGETACASLHMNSTVTSTTTTTTVPPLILFLLDRTGSMANRPQDLDDQGNCINSNNCNAYYPTSYSCSSSTKWTGVVQNDAQFAQTKFGYLRSALDGLLNSSTLSDYQIAVTFFNAPGTASPQVTNSIARTECNADYSTPQIPLGFVNSNGTNNHALLNCWTGITPMSDAACTGLSNLYTEPSPIFSSSRCTVSIAPVLPDGDTPMNPALGGAIQYMQNLTTDATGAAIDPSTNRIVVLVTDGAPTICDNVDLEDVQETAEAGISGSPSVLTYTVGVPGADPNLANVAAAGGGQAFTISASSSNYQNDLINAFQSIATSTTTTTTTSSMPCSFNVPTPDNGQLVDPLAVNVQLTAGSSTTTIQRDTDESNGWDYTSGGQQITLFGDACNAIQTDSSASIDIFVACDSVQQVETGGGGNVCGVQGASCSGEGTCCLGYYCNSSGICDKNSPVVQ